jgi:hypothetical protein
MNSKQKSLIQKKFQELIDKACDESFKKYLVSKTREGYKYHSFTLKKTPEGFFNCFENEKIVFEYICSFEIALSLCYNYLYKKNNYIHNKMQEVNEQASKHKMDLYFYHHRLEKCNYEEYCLLQARITESKTEYQRAKMKIRTLTKAL